MPEGEQTPQRVTATQYLLRAREHIHRGKTDRALEEGELALEADPTFDEARLFLAETFDTLGQTRKAVHHYEALLFKDPDNKDLMQRVQRLDPMTAEKHRRLSEVAPDPFVSGGRVAVGSNDLAEMEAMDVLDDQDSEGELGVAVESATELVDMEAAPAAPQIGGGPQVRAEAGLFADDGPQGVEQPTAVECRVYEYEDEPQYRETLRALPTVQELLSNQRRLWASSRELEDLLAESRSLTPIENADAEAAFGHAHSVIGAATTVPQVVTDPSLVPLVCGPISAYAMIPTGALEALSEGELYFLAGRTLARVTCEHVALLELAAALLPPSRPSSRLQQVLLQTAAATIGTAQAIEDESMRRKAQTHLHTWRLRAELTADRAGLICCRDPQTAASAIAKLTAPDVAAAQAASPESLEQRFSGQDIGQLAAIRPEHDPETSEPYAYYRIRMLNWWSTQPAYKQVTSQS